MIKRRLKPKVILVPRKKKVEEGNKKTLEHAYAALQVKTSERTKQDVDTIMEIVGKWPDFVRFIHTEQERREVCRCMTGEEKKGNTILFKQGDDPDGWYLVFSGLCSVYIMWGDESKHAMIPPAHLSLLRSALGADKNFFCVAKKHPTQEFGSTALTNNDVRNATIIIDEPSYLLRVDPQLYRDTAAWFDRQLLEKKAALLSHIPQFQFLRSLPEQTQIFTRLAENMKEHHFLAGDTIGRETIVEGFFVVEEGLLAKQRVVDFSTYKESNKPNQNDNNFSIPIKIPKGKHSVRVANYGPKTMFPDPNLKDYVPYPFTITVIEPAITFELKLSDLSSLLLTTQIQKIKESIRNEPTDSEVIQMWIQKQQAIQWKLFKHKCVKEARKTIKVEKDISNGMFAVRKSGPPKPIKNRSLPAFTKKSYA
ncbi:cyclic nucleotide-binding domain containing protein [Histomonas meleagridis]|uniref:cyclic nucleotide-binding domain containing protein n=1 Tax=Histomonas meleagridis TaxID=135588 RepID=UPI0035596210|nr:cyclic nucleotide-binding domain containing protein [Histomonas meleagridis]KAH0806971.1 cyclic nucleotide-binding domain containing protein [Histomonas meleagridis]